MRKFFKAFENPSNSGRAIFLGWGVLCALLAIIGLIGAAYSIPYSGWFIAIGLFTFIAI